MASYHHRKSSSVKSHTRKIKTKYGTKHVRVECRKRRSGSVVKRRR